MKNRGFTLIELLVVIAVIGILAAIFLPALSRSKAVAKRIHCVGNLKQLALATHLYVGDHQDRLPSGFNYNVSPTPTFGISDRHYWTGLLWDGYLDGNTNVFQCAGKPPSSGGFRFLFNHSYGWNDYGLNENASISPYFRRKGRPIKLAEVVAPADCVALGDIMRPNLPFVTPLSQHEIALHESQPGLFSLLFPRYAFSISRRHYGYANMAFLDGHVEHGSLRDWTLPVESVHRRWHWDGKAHLDRLTYRDAENWSPLYSFGEKPPAD